MTTRYEILPLSQRRLLPLLAPLKDLGFVLYGGTAIALQLGHRMSVDFDFFSHREEDREALYSAVPRLAQAVVLQDKPATLTVQDRSGDEPVKLSFFSGLGFGRVGAPALDDRGELRLASRLDLLGHKLKVLLQRVEAKDYADISALLRAGLPLSDGLGAARALFPTFPPCEALRAMTYFEGGDLGRLDAADRAVLVAAASGATIARAMALAGTTLD